MQNYVRNVAMKVGRRQLRPTGMVSIMVTMVLMLVISLIVLGFAQVSRREQRAALDRQLSTQAFLAAESGVNDARKVAQDAIAAGNQVPEKTSCDPDPANYPDPPAIDLANDVSYTCLLVTTHVKNITINPVSAGKDSTNFPLESTTDPIDKISINWKALNQPTDQTLVNTNCSKGATGYFPSASNWKCPYGVLRMDIIPTGTLNRDAMANGQKTIFFYPTGAGGGATVDFADSNGAVVPMGCVVTTGCNIDILGVTGSNKYAVRVSSTYVSGMLDVTAYAGINQLELKNAQIQVDVTGKAQDVLRRVQVRLPFMPGAKSPDYALASGSSICKRFQTTDSSFAIPNDIVDQDQNNPMCETMSAGTPITPPPSTTACVKRGPNRVTNGDFHLGAGPLATVDPAVYGFTTKLPNRGPNTFPDDGGVNGSSNEFRGWRGGLSVMTFGPQSTLNGPNVLYAPFLGDKDPEPDVPANPYAAFTNPYQSIDEPKGFDPGGATTFKGVLWQANLTNLKPKTKYDFTGYFSNVLTPFYINATPGVVNAEIEFSIDGTILRPKEVIEPSNSAWEPISLTFTTGDTQTSGVFAIKDYAGYQHGDDFAMTSLGVYECLD